MYVKVLGRMNNAVETVNAAANAFTFAEARAPPRPTSDKWRWSGCWRWSIHACFGTPKHNKRIGPAETPTSSHTQPPPIALHFAAPPSSPAASLLPSEPPSPAGLASLASISANMYSIFAVGPYAHETHLVVSPPVFSAFTTQPSSAPFTPPPESLHLTTPSSPEVPFAKLLNPSLHCDVRCADNKGLKSLPRVLQTMTLEESDEHGQHA